MPASLAQDCASVKPFYIPVETARAALGLRGETRAEFFDRFIGAGAWEEAQGGGVEFETPSGGPIRVRVAPSEDKNLRIELFVESRIAYIDVDNRERQITGHRPLGSYDLAGDESAEISVPLDVFREPGALLAAVGAPAMRGARRFIVHALAIKSEECSARVYVEDRFTAIRLNREAGN